MQKKELFRKTNNERKEKSTIFISIDDLTKTNSNNYQEHDLNKTKDYLSIKYNDEIYNQINNSTIGKFYYDIDYISLGVLLELLESLNSNLVITTNENQNKEEVLSLLRLYDLDKYTKDIINSKNYQTKSLDILNYIKNNNINKYIVISEYDYTKEFGENFRRKINHLKLEDIIYTNIVFNSSLSIKEEQNKIILSNNNQSLIELKYKNYNIHNLNILLTILQKLNFIENQGKEYIEYMINYLTKAQNSDYILFDVSKTNNKNLNISGALDNNNIYTINITQNDKEHLIIDCKKKILSINC